MVRLRTGYVIEDGDLATDIGGGFPTIPVHAYIPMKFRGARMTSLEDPPIAYLNQMRAKRVADAARKRAKRRNPRYYAKYIIMGVTVK